MAFKRDPASLYLDRGARELLSRAYAAPGEWVRTRLADPPQSVAHRLRAAGIRWKAPDPIEGQACRTRWGRAFNRALWHQHNYYSADPDTGGWRERPRTIRRGNLTLRVLIGQYQPPQDGRPGGHTVSLMVIPRDADARAHARGKPRPVPQSLQAERGD